jgi:hypothetical protein
MTANAPVKYSDLLGAFEWVNAGAPGDNSAYISRISGISGRIYWDSDAMELDEKPPEDIDDGARYLEVPHKHRLDLGNNLVFRFTEAYLPDEYAQVKGFFRRTGAYRKFKDLLDRRNALKAWHEYENEAVENALREWSADNELPLID